MIISTFARQIKKKTTMQCHFLSYENVVHPFYKFIFSDIYCIDQMLVDDWQRWVFKRKKTNVEKNTQILFCFWLYVWCCMSLPTFITWAYRKWWTKFERENTLIGEMGLWIRFVFMNIFYGFREYSRLNQFDYGFFGVRVYATVTVIF